MAASSIHYIFTVCRDHLDERKQILKTNLMLRTVLEKPFAKSWSIDSSIHFILRVDRECAERIRRANAVAMGRAEIGNRWGGQRSTYFGRREPWGAPTRTIRMNHPKRARADLEF